MVRTILSRPASDPLTAEFTPSPDWPPDEPAVATALDVAAAGFAARVANPPIGVLADLAVPDAASALPSASRLSVGALSPARDQPDPVGWEPPVLVPLYW